MKFFQILIINCFILSILCSAAPRLPSPNQGDAFKNIHTEIEAGERPLLKAQPESQQTKMDVRRSLKSSGRRLRKTLTSISLAIPIALSSMAPAFASLKFKGPDAEQKHIKVIKRSKTIVNPSIEQIPLKNVVSGPDSLFQPKDFGDAFGKKTLTCTFLDKNSEAAEGATGITDKFWCKDDGEFGGREWKIKYSFQDNKTPNQEPFTEVATTRLLWLMGFGADVVNPVTVNCINCPKDPWTDHYRNPKAKPVRTDGRVTTFRFASVEEKFPGESLKYKLPGESTKKGWDFDDLLAENDEDSKVLNQNLAEKQAMSSVAALLWNIDTKSGNNRLVCAPGSVDADNCLNPISIWQDTGWSFGGVHMMDRRTQKLSFNHWSKVKGLDKACRIDQKVLAWGLDLDLSDEALKIVQDRLGSITEDQWKDLFMVAQFNLHRYGRPSRQDPVYGNMKTNEAWADVMMKKVDSIMNIRSCQK